MGASCRRSARHCTGRSPPPCPPARPRGEPSNATARPGDPRLRAGEGHALMGLRRWAEARERCEAALAAGAGAHITLGLVLAFLGEPEAGEAHLQRALELSDSPEDTARAYVHLGEVR